MANTQRQLSFSDRASFVHHSSPYRSRRLRRLPPSSSVYFQVVAAGGLRGPARRQFRSDHVFDDDDHVPACRHAADHIQRRRVHALLRRLSTPGQHCRRLDRWMSVSDVTRPDGCGRSHGVVVSTATAHACTAVTAHRRQISLLRWVLSRDLFTKGSLLSFKKLTCH